MTKIEELVRAWDEGYTMPYVEDRLEAALTELRALRWIPVEERLPENNVDVEVVGLNPAGSIDEQRRWYGCYDREYSAWFEAQGGDTMESVTHWREIPPGPKGRCGVTKIEELVKAVESASAVAVEKLQTQPDMRPVPLWYLADARAVAEKASNALPELRAVVIAERRLRERRAAVDEAIEGLGGEQ